MYALPLASLDRAEPNCTSSAPPVSSIHQARLVSFGNVLAAEGNNRRVFQDAFVERQVGGAAADVYNGTPASRSSCPMTAAAEASG